MKTTPICRWRKNPFAHVTLKTVWGDSSSPQATGVFPVAYLGYCRHGLCYRCHFRGASKIAWEKQKFVTFSFSYFYFGPHTAFTYKSGSIHCSYPHAFIQVCWQNCVIVNKHDTWKLYHSSNLHVSTRPRPSNATNNAKSVWVQEPDMEKCRPGASRTVPLPTVSGVTRGVSQWGAIFCSVSVSRSVGMQ